MRTWRGGPWQARGCPGGALGSPVRALARPWAGPGGPWVGRWGGSLLFFSNLLRLSGILKGLAERSSEIFRDFQQVFQDFQRCVFYGFEGILPPVPQF